MPSTLVSHLWCLQMKKDSLGAELSISNQRVRTDRNLHTTFQSRHHLWLSINSWAGMLGDILLQRLTGHSHLGCTVNTLPESLEDVPLGRRAQMWFMHDSAPPHFTIAVSEHLHSIYLEQWVGHSGITAWPLHSSGFFLVGTFEKSGVCCCSQWCGGPTAASCRRMPSHSQYSRDVWAGMTVITVTCSALCGSERSVSWAFALTAWLLSPFMQNVYKEN
jgi:hypothetical protein